MSISKGKMFADYNKSKKLLNSLGIKFQEEIEKARTLNKADFSQDFIKSSYKDNYFEVYKIAREKLDYNLLLDNDGAFFQFSFKEENNRISELRYAYYEAPTDHISYEEFIKIYGFDIEECGYELMEEYNQYISEAELKMSVTPLRYDYNENQYDELIHSISHLHIGQSNEIRIPLSFVMTPLNFVAFIVRHIYWHFWRAEIKDEKFKELYLGAHNSVKLIDKEMFSEIEKKDIFLSV